VQSQLEIQTMMANRTDQGGVRPNAAGYEQMVVVLNAAFKVLYYT
jgi:hypothetical protein